MPSDTSATALSGPSPQSVGEEIARLTTEIVDEVRLDFDSLTTVQLVEEMNADQHSVPVAVGKIAPQIGRAVDQITARLERGGRLVYVGAGTAGRLGVLDASECPPTFGTPHDLVIAVIAGGESAIRRTAEGAEDDAERGRTDLAAVDVGPLDCVVGISASGRTPYVIGALEYAHAQGALTIALACNASSRIGAMSDLALEVVVGPEFLAGSTRLKAGTAQKLVLNLLSTLTMVRLGRTYGNVMVDLVVSNAKLRARAERIVASVAGVEVGDAAAALTRSDGSAKLAIMSLKGGLSIAEARDALKRHDGHLQKALAGL